jgi:hypothetical protein
MWDWPADHRIGSFSSTCGDGPDGIGPNILQEPCRGKHARKIPVRLPWGPYAETNFTPVRAKCEPDFSQSGRRVEAPQLLKGQ